jgi:diacylglycerol kinase
MPSAVTAHSQDNEKKSLPLYKRIGFSLDGLKAAWRAESSLRLEAAAIFIAIVLLAVFHASIFWWAIFAVLAAGIASAELMNTAIENICDLFHPEVHARIKVVKDCASAAVFLLNTAGLLLVLLFLFYR